MEGVCCYVECIECSCSLSGGGQGICLVEKKCQSMSLGFLLCFCDVFRNIHIVVVERISKIEVVDL